ncbi:MAG TPA: phosphatidate cytidylyltransferase [Caulobacteraceae bacterium]|jgi:phosphatidate cytidylyltransferase|nr:phosphatidate cytidylyltransferase [Caulobacteraceae bacterium]
MTLPPSFAATPFNQIAPALFWGMAGVLVLLVLGTAAALLLPVLQPARDHTNLRQRMLSWWVMAALVGAALLLGWPATLGLFALISFMALREFLSLAPLRREDRLVVLLAYLVIPANYGLLAIDRYGIYLVFIPVWTFMFGPFILAMIGQTRAYLSTAAIFNWGLITCVYNIGFAAYLARTPLTQAPQAGGAGLVFFLLLATEANDVAQYVWGKLTGRHKITPKVSPNKTWEGFLGGWATTALLIWFVGPWFLPLRGWPLAVLAASMPVAGFAGDVTMSAVKRDLGVKDTSQTIPGHGGVLDRIDSLTFTAPLYFHLIIFFCFSKLPWP